MIERWDIACQSENQVCKAFNDNHISCYQIAANILGPCDLILDAASGLGHGYPWLAPLGEYIGIDVSYEAVEAAQAANPQAKYLFRDLDRFGCFGELQPDAIVSIYTAEHLHKPLLFLREVLRTLKPGGKFIFAVPTNLTMDYDPYHRVDWSHDEWESALSGVGFDIDERHPLSIKGTFTQFCRMAPTTWRQRLRVAGFIAARPRYLRDRVWNWLLHNRFELTSTLWACRKPL